MHVDTASLVPNHRETGRLLVRNVGRGKHDRQVLLVHADSLGRLVVDQSEVRAGDTLTVKSSLIEVKAKSIRFVHEMWNDDRAVLAARTTIVAVHLSTETRKSCELPQDVRERIRSLIGDQASLSP